MCISVCYYVMSSWVCTECEYENEPAEPVCAACEEPRRDGGAGEGTPCEEEDAYAHICVGRVVQCAEVRGSKLRRLKVAVSSGADDASALDVVTSASNVREGQKIAVACVGAVVHGERVTKTSIKGCPSHGMVCDSAMLGWSGGGAGAAAILPDDCVVGSPPPRTRPRPVQ